MVFVALVVLNGCKTSPQVVTKDYDRVDLSEMLPPASWAGAVQFKSRPTSKTSAVPKPVSSPVAIVRAASVTSARPLSLVVRDGVVVAQPRPDLCIRVHRRTVGTYQDFDHVGGWKYSGPAIGLVSAIALAAYASHASSQRDGSLPASALETNPYVLPGTLAQEDWQRRVTISAGTAAGVAAASGLVFAGNWWTAKSVPQRSRRELHAEFVDPCKTSDVRIVFRPSEVGIRGFTWARMAGTRDELALSNPVRSDRAAFGSLLKMQTTGIVDIAFTADVKLAGPPKTLLQTRLRGVVRQRFFGDDPLFGALIRAAASAIVPRAQPLQHGELSWDPKSDVLSLSSRCGAYMDGLTSTQQAKLRELAPSAFSSEGGHFFQSATPAQLTSTRLLSAGSAKFGKPTRLGITKTAPNLVCTVEWQPPDSPELDKWLHAVLVPSLLPSFLGQGDSGWRRADDRRRVLERLLAAGLPLAQERVVGLEQPHSNSISFLGGLIKAHEDGTCVDTALGETWLAAVDLTCKELRSRAGVCKSWRSLRAKAKRVLRQLAQPKLLELARPVLARGDCVKDVEADQDTNVNETVTENCLGADYDRLSALVARAGPLADAGLANKLVQFRNRQRATVQRAIAKAKQEAAAARRQEAREAAAERREEAREAAREAAEERRNRGRGGGGGSSDYQPASKCMRVAVACCGVCGGFISGGNCVMVRGTCFAACGAQNGCY